MDALIHYISTQRLKAFTGPFNLKPFSIFFSFLMLSLTLFCTTAGAVTPLCKQPTPPSQLIEQSNQLRQIWQDTLAEPWFYDNEGQPTVLTIDENWLAVRFATIFASGSDMPEMMRKFNQRYAEAFIDIIYNPAQPDLGIYRFKPTHRNGVINTIFSDGDSTIRYILPAFITKGQSRILGEQINIEWKSQIRPQRRQQLLQSIGAIDYSEDLTSREEVIQIDPRQISSWQAANRLAEDIQVVRATPKFLDVEEPINVQFSLASQGGVAGSSIPFSLDIHFNDDVKIELGTLANLNLKPAEIFRNLFAVEYDTPLSAVDTRRSPIQLRGQIYIYASGEFALPSIPIFYRNTSNDGSKVHRISTPEINVRMAALVPEAEGNYQLQVPAQLSSSDTFKYNAQSHLISLWPTLIATIVLVIGLALILQRKIKNKHQLQPQTIVVEKTPLELLHKTLEPPQKLTSVGQMLRCYLIDFTGATDLSTGGGSQLFFDKIQTYFTQEDQFQIKELLQHLDTALACTLSEVEVIELLKRIKQLTVALEKQRSCESLNRNSRVPNS